jgi:biotin carboxyl carrier protein
MKLKITVHGVAYEVDVEVLDPGDGFAPRARPLPVPPPPPIGSAANLPLATSTSRETTRTATDDALHVVASPIAGVVTEVRCRPGDTLAQGDVLLIIEAMKMNNSITAPATARVKAVVVAAGDSVREGQTLVELE